jgi:hypothetical protein
MGKDAPKPPDPYRTAQAQSAANKDAAIATAAVNAVDRYSPYGSTTYQYRTDGPYAGAPASQTISFAPQIQAAYDAQVGTAGNVADFAQTLSGRLPTAPFSLADVPQGLDVASAIANQSFDRIRPEIDRNRDLLNIQLSERGIPLGAEISDTERDRFERGVNQAYADIGNQSVLAAQGEQQRQIQNALLERTQGLNEIAAALQGSPALQTPSFAGQAQVGIGAPDIAGLIQNSYAQQAQATNSQNAAKASLLGSVGQAAVLGF